EFNRYSYYKAPDGRLLMGTVAGLNIIDPSALKEQLSLGNYPKIYLTEIQYYNKKKEANITLARQAEFGRRIELAADNRNLKLQFALSSYFLPEKNQYAYKLEGINEDWHYIGTQRELSLSNLPAGQYKLLIKGSDYRGIWSEQMVAANIHARDFFYRQYWFYLLCFAVVGAVVFIWISYLRGEKKRLEQEVKKRTRQIRR
ncbi:MAG: hypothetical protein KDD99_33075, partial [Bacteroidetes bacterium]|nr:hypothetical protein [Bacteroidota bacterium]